MAFIHTVVWCLHCRAEMSRKESLGLRVWPLLWTRYHLRLADRAWRRKLARFMEERLHGKLPEDAWGLGCVVRGSYPAERHMGPHSAVKHHFEVVCSWWRGWGLWERESCRVSVRFVPATGEFRVRSEEWSTRELRHMKASRKRAVDGMLDRILAGCLLSELDSFSCPSCGAPMSVAFEPESEGAYFYEPESEGEHFCFVLSCSADARHVHREAITEHPPAWWEQKASKGR